MMLFVSLYPGMFEFPYCLKDVFLQLFLIKEKNPAGWIQTVLFWASRFCQSMVCFLELSCFPLFRIRLVVSAFPSTSVSF